MMQKRIVRKSPGFAFDPNRARPDAAPDAERKPPAAPADAAPPQG